MPPPQSQSTPPAATIPPQESDSSKEGADKNSYVRTYAKDLALASGKPVPASPLATKQTLQEAVADDAARVPEKAPSDKPDPWTAPAPPTGRTPDEILAGLKEKAVAERERPKNVIALDESRGEILARLLKKSEAVHAPIATPEPPPPSIPPVQKPIPPPPAPKEEQPSPIHTFKSDFSEHTKEKKANVFAILAAEQDRSRRAPPQVIAKPVNPLPIIAGIMLLFLGGLGIFFAFQFATETPPIPVPLKVPSIIFADATLELVGDAPYLDELQQVSETTIVDGGLVVTYISIATGTPTGITSIPQNGSVLFRALGLKAPDVLLRNITDESTLGLVEAGGETRPFFLLRVASFDRTFAGMLAWEPLMEHDLTSIYPPHPGDAPLPAPAPLASSTVATSTTKMSSTTTETVPLNTLDLGPGEFIDEVVDNHDVRVLYDGQGRSLMLYGYKDKRTLIITRNKEAFREILNRLSSTRTN